MFPLVSVRHVGAHPGEQQHGVSIQISKSLGKTFLRISRIRNIPLTWILARVFVYVPPFISQILDFIYWTVLIFSLIYFEWRDTENQQYIRLCRLVFTFVPWLKSLSEKLLYWLVSLFMQIPKCDHSNESNTKQHFPVTAYYAVQGGSNFEVCEWNP